MLEAVVQFPELPIRPGELAKGQLLVLMAWLTMSRELYRILGVLVSVIRVWAGHFDFSCIELNFRHTDLQSSQETLSNSKATWQKHAVRMPASCINQHTLGQLLFVAFMDFKRSLMAKRHCTLF